MKKALPLLLSLVLCLTLCACGKSKAAQAVDDMIMEIGEVSLDSKSLIEKADNELRILSQEDREQVENTAILEDAKAVLQNLQDNAIAKAIDDAINSIGEVTLNSSAKIQNASRLYNSASETTQSKVENFDILKQAIKTLRDLKVQAAVDAINNIGEVTLDSQYLIEAAKTVYNNLNLNEQTLVENADTLKQADKKFTELKQQEQERVKEQALSRLKVETDKVQHATWYMPKAYPTYINERCFMLPYMTFTGNKPWLYVKINYTGDRWVFFDRITIYVDGRNYYKTFSYNEITRDNNSDVWEYVDIHPTEDDLQMLQAIANSNETIIRFEGDDRQHDFTVRDSDKSAINDVLTAYEALNNG